MPGINETLTRLPADKPLADSPWSPLVQTALATLLGLFLYFPSRAQVSPAFRAFMDVAREVTAERP